MDNNLAPHEILNIQELLNTNILETKIITNNSSAIQDENLKQLTQEIVTNKKTKLKELEDFINSNMSLGNNQSNNQNNNQSGNQGNDQNNNQG